MTLAGRVQWINVARTIKVSIFTLKRTRSSLTSWSDSDFKQRRLLVADSFFFLFFSPSPDLFEVL